LRKIVNILFVLTITSCTVFKQTNTNVVTDEDASFGSVARKTKNLNITNQCFLIAKAEIILSEGNQKESFIASVKFSFPDKYLISLRSKSGIEGARIYLTGDTLLINDRINRKLYYGEPDYIRKKFGISASALPLIFGDMIFKDSGDSENLKCIDGYLNFNKAFMGLRYETSIDCKKSKMISCIQQNDKEGEQVIMRYSKYMEKGNCLFPSFINIFYREMNVSIKIRKVEIPWEGNLEFIAGNKYELIYLK